MDETDFRQVLKQMLQLNEIGGENAYKETLERDELKRAYLKKENINLLEVHYLEENVEEVIMKFISQLPK